MAQRYVPTWRAHARRTRSLPRHTIGALSSACFLLLYYPALHPDGLATPISFQIAARAWYALALVAILGIVATLVSLRLFKGGQWGGGLVLLADLGGLAFISGSNPKSGDHLFAYICVAIISVVWLLWVAIDEQDPVLEWLAYGAAGGVLVSFALMGIGERILLTCLLAGINLLYYGYFRHD